MSEFKPSPQLNAPRSAHVAAPYTKARETLPGCAGQGRGADVGGESPIISADIEIAVIHKHVIDERVIELRSDLQVHAFSQSSFLGDRKIHVLEVRAPEI